MKLSVGLINATSYWEELLSQIGVSVKKIEADEISHHTYPLIILGSKNKINQNVVYNYISSGGSILMEAMNAKKLLGIPYQRKKIKYFFPQNDDIFNFKIYSEVGENLLVPSQANHLADQDKTNTILVKNIEQGNVVVLPEGLLQLIFSYKIKRKKFYSKWGNEIPTERVSKIDKGGVYHILYRILEYLFHKKNLPFIRLWQFPDGYETIFGFRIDTDFASDDDIINLQKTLAKNKIKATWFIETLSRKKDCKIFKEFSDQEIALHCYHHKSYPDERNNFKDINKGLKILNRNSLKSLGYASPFGEWNESLGKALERIHFNYSSEFGYINDTLPVFPLVDGIRSDVLQIPIHPVSVGRLNIAGHSEKEIINYFSLIIEKKKKEFEPIFFYTHPSQKRLNIFDQIFKSINDSGIVSITFNDYAVWWKKRKAVNWEAELNGETIFINTEEINESIWIHSSYSNRKNYLTPIKAGETTPGKEILPKQLDLFSGFNPGVMSKRSLKIFKQELIYNYRKLKH